MIMRFSRFLIAVLSIMVLASCHSKKQVVHKPIAKAHPKVIEKNEDVVTKEQGNSSDTNSLIFKSTEAYINYFKDAAIEEMKIYKIPASITLAQGIIESSSGNSELTKRSNNHFGIKCHKEWDGDRTYHDDDEKGECFRVYKDPAKSYRDHSLFLTLRSRYSDLFKLDQGDYVGWAKGLSDAGYATDRRYPAKLIGLIEKFELHKYDTQVLGKSYTVNSGLKEKIVSEKVVANVASKSGYHTVNYNDTLFSIANKYGISVNELKELNNLTTDTISIGQNLKYSKNSDTSVQVSTLKEHIVEKGDTLYNISKRYGISVEDLKRINNLQSNELSIGQSILTK